MAGLFTSTTEEGQEGAAANLDIPAVDKSWPLNLSTLVSGEPNKLKISLAKKGGSTSQRGGGKKRRACNMDPPILSIPSTFPMVFRPTVDMGLTKQQLKLVAYAFGDNLSTSEVLFKNKTTELHRKTMRTLCPLFPPHPELITISVLIASEVAAKSLAPRTWYLPYDFASHVEEEASLETMVFVPISDPIDGWYVLLLDVHNKERYVLDVCRSEERIPHRLKLMEDTCGVLGKMFVTDRNSVNFWQGSPDPTEWGDFLFPDSIPHDLTRNETGAWCLFWLQQDGVFSNRILGHMGSSDRVWMRAAWYILQSDSNQMRGYIKARADLLWRYMDVGTSL
ncbi:hypothetical protein PIB30_078520 [Stylosanthes scabra]|uniref:Ubiquitin-like protease family profile domain-containing protein n=1 Tax=Stylosanthes scabra TaxID=79078 RepID=A0ABU6RQP7_9FABA|nr:hypothetical protein [Stylosanthes scabra]